MSSFIDSLGNRRKEELDDPTLARFDLGLDRQARPDTAGLAANSDGALSQPNTGSIYQARRQRLAVLIACRIVSRRAPPPSPHYRSRIFIGGVGVGTKLVSRQSDSQFDALGTPADLKHHRGKFEDATSPRTAETGRFCPAAFRPCTRTTINVAATGIPGWNRLRDFKIGC